MVKPRRSMLKDVVTIETFTGEGAFGPAFAAPVTVKVNVDNTRRLVRNAAGAEVISEATLISHPQPRDEATGLLLDATTIFTPESRITVLGRTATVIGVGVNTIRGNTAFVKATIT